mgnify:CR=1 FL=1
MIPRKNPIRPDVGTIAPTMPIASVTAISAEDRAKYGDRRRIAGMDAARTT